jgi:hypothetical protein
MSNPTHVHVTAPEGRRTPIHRNDGIESNGGQLHVESAEVRRVVFSQDVRRAVARGDLVLCNMHGVACDLDKAGAPDELEGGRAAVKPRHHSKVTP